MHVSRVCGCFVLFNPGDNHHLDAIANVCRTGSPVVVFDNSDDDAVADQNERRIAALSLPNASYLRAGGNIGLSSAFNRIIEFATKLKGVDEIVLFDQDSSVEGDDFTRLVDGYRRAAASMNIGVYSAYAIRSDGTAYRWRRARFVATPAPFMVPVQFTPSSFSLIPLATFRKIGRFYDDFFIDHIDVDFGRRCWRAGLAVIVDTGVPFLHRIGSGDLVVCGRPLFPISAPFRHYYQVRNIVLSAQRGGATWFGAALEVIRRFIAVTLSGLQAGQLGLRYRYALAGLRDAVRSRGGAMPRLRD